MVNEFESFENAFLFRRIHLRAFYLIYTVYIYETELLAKLNVCPCLIITCISLQVNQYRLTCLTAAKESIGEIILFSQPLTLSIRIYEVHYCAQAISFEAFDALGHGGKPCSLQYIMYYLKAEGDGEIGKSLQDH